MSKVSEIIGKKGGDVATIGREDTTLRAVEIMNERRIGALVVVSEGMVVGIFTERDVLIRIIDRGRNPATLTLGDVMVRDPECLHKQASIAWVLNKMSVGGFRHVPTVDDEGRPACVVSVRDVVQFLVDSFPTEILNLPPEHGAERYQTRDGA